MGYLFSQIAVSLILAGIVGAVAGWLIYRAKAAKVIRSLQHVVGQQQQEVNEAQTAVSIIAGDFDDLKQSSETQISALKQENQKIPSLNQNLEKSQLLVRQLMQKHKAEFDELSIENQKLSASAKLANDREQAINKLQAELETEKRKNGNATDAPEKLNGKSVGNKDSKLDSNLDSKNASVSDYNGAKNPAENEQDANSSAGDDNVGKQKTSVFSMRNDKKSISTNVTTNDINGTNSVVAKDDDGVDSNSTARRLPLSGNTTVNGAMSSSIGQSFAESARESDGESIDVASGSDSSGVVSSTTDEVTAEAERELNALREQLSDESANAPDSDNLLDSEDPLFDEEEDDLEPMFDPVDQHDDLKQIFGIGPVTEKTLNQLGITAYSQLAELKQHDIEKIAEALEIVPGRIERENWIGSARTQLEEVLEEL